MFPQLVNEEMNNLNRQLEGQRIDKSRFVFSKKTQEEFNLKTSDIPIQNRREEHSSHINHVDKNVMIADKFNELSKLVYLSKIKLNC